MSSLGVGDAVWDIDDVRWVKEHILEHGYSALNLHIFANANTIGGSAGRMTKTLEAAGFTMGDPVNANETLEDSIVYYDTSVAAARAVAESVGVVMGGLVVEAVPTPPPTGDGTMGDGSVLLMLGNNEADHSSSFFVSCFVRSGSCQARLTSSAGSSAMLKSTVVSALRHSFQSPIRIACPL